MQQIAIIGLEKNSTWEFYHNHLHLQHKYSVKLVPFIYSNKQQSLYDRLNERGLKPGNFVAAISVGGDGTFLYVSRVFAGSDVPIFGINKGHFGFNTSIEENEFEIFFQQFMEKQVHFEYKTLLDVNIEGDSKSYLIVNEGVIAYLGISRMIRLKVELEGVSLCNFRGDGLIISSPTGSTAYNLSAGGPILHPSVEAFVICPICPHTLAIRPYIIPLSQVIKVWVEESTAKQQITLDGQKSIALQVGQRVIFKKSQHQVKIVRGSKNFSEILEKKLGWKL